ncbi:MAG: Coenzyme F420 hydrogenase/dehydrogenase, beta subunit C-terminal domain [Opitutales bacterium]|nr:Coenzyme F420 hydrogenase/dehydrogenase, beta subunit C-terminal domain [Opitutales bacterium]NRA27195.1 Coenzyme F420 hydrogenase/dehydrogenase, beta subunit C-terminal domain [Opitutales bacterium]
MRGLVQPNFDTPVGDFRKAWIGHMTDPDVRRHAASGGIVTGVFKYLLETGQIDAALVCGMRIENGTWQPDIYLSRSFDELKRSQSSKYFDIPMMKGLSLIKEFDGKVGVVGLPSQINTICKRMAQNEELAQKIAFKISIFCGHNSKDTLVKMVLAKHGIPLDEIDSFYYRQGLWRGEMVIKMKDGSERRMPFQQFSHYQNLHVLSLSRCLHCFDHYGYYADLSTGDVWLPEKKGETVKPSAFLARSEKAEGVMQEMLDNGLIDAHRVTRKTIYHAQSRSVNYHYNVTARARVGRLLGFKIREDIQTKATIRDYLGAFIVLLNHKISKHPNWLARFMKLPFPFVFAYVVLFKGLMHYKRPEYEQEPDQ